MNIDAIRRELDDISFAQSLLEKGRKKMEDYIRLQAASQPSKYAAFHYTIYDNPYLDRVYIDQERANCSDDVWRQQYLAEYV